MKQLKKETLTAVCINSSSTFDDSDAVTYTIAYSTSYCYDRENKNLLVTTDSDGTIVKYVYGNGLISSYETVADTTEYQSYSYDIRGSVTSVSDENGTVTAEYSYSTHGERTVIEGKTSILGYCARDGVLTETNGLIYMRARYYSTELMRFINEDIITGDISNSNSLNRYAYVQGNPATMIDPFGLDPTRLGTYTQENLKNDLIAAGWKEPAISDEYISMLYATLVKHQINTTERVRMFLAQCQHETMNGLYFQELGSDSYLENKSYGKKYSGVGAIQLTWEYGYEAFATYQIIENVPELAGEIKYRNPLNNSAEVINREYLKAVKIAEEKK